MNITIHIPQLLMDATKFTAVCVLFVFFWACIVSVSIWSYARWAKTVKLYNAIRVYLSLKLYKPDHAAINSFMCEAVEEWVRGSRARFWALRGIVKRAAEQYPDESPEVPEFPEYNYSDVLEVREKEQK